MNDESEASAQKPETPKSEADKSEAPKQERILKREVFSFTGKAKEYFGIWIVNLLLTLVTLGLYSAWAKVRRQRYFYGNTWLDGHNFEYHAKPKQILIGRIIVFGLFMISNLVGAYLPEFWILLFLLFIFLLPWLINKAISFNARVSTYRNVQFGFEGSYSSAFKIFVLLPMIIPFIVGIGVYLHYASHSADSFYHVGTAEITYFDRYLITYKVSLGFIMGIAGLLQILLYPFLSKMTVEYIGNRLTYGSAPFKTKARLAPLLSNFVLSAVVALLLMMLIGLVLWIGYYFVVFDGENIPPQNTATFLLIVFYLGVGLSYQFYKAGVRNVVYAGTRLDDKHQMLSSLSRLKYFSIQATNFLAVIFTIGLLRPWAAIRLRRYIVEHTAIDVDGTLEDIVAENEPDGSVVAAEIFDVEGIDFGF